MIQRDTKCIYFAFVMYLFDSSTGNKRIVKRMYCMWKYYVSVSPFVTYEINAIMKLPI